MGERPPVYSPRAAPKIDVYESSLSGARTGSKKPGKKERKNNPDKVSGVRTYVDCICHLRVDGRTDGRTGVDVSSSYPPAHESASALPSVAKTMGGKIDGRAF